MFELSVARKYLTPRWRQLSVSIISLISILVIALVVWLIVVFFSVTNGLEKGWVQKLTTLTAPVRITPNENYYNSYYYLVDGISQDSNYAQKSIREKLQSLNTDPYDESMDETFPSFFPQPVLNSDGSLKDLVKQAYFEIEHLNQDSEIRNRLKSDQIIVDDFEVTTSQLRVKLIRNINNTPMISSVTQATYLGSFNKENQTLEKTMIPFSMEDLQNLVRTHNLKNQKLDELPLTSKKFQKDLQQFLSKASNQDLKKLDFLNILGNNHGQSDAVFLPKTFRDAGVLVGDKTEISYYTPTMSAVQEQKIPTFVAGFYDPGLIPLGGKFILTAPEIVSLVRTSQAQEQTPNSNGINVRFDNLDNADLVKAKIQAAFNKAGIAPFFKIETYKEFEFTKDILQQLQSDKTLFTLISTIIIIVACSNIISMLIIMVNDKKVEIGILRSMGTSSFSIATIFGLCGVVMGATGSAIGTFAAYFTLKNLKILIDFLSTLQGHNAFNPMFYGDTLPNEISFEAMFFVIFSTALISTIAGIVPAVKASMLHPSAILRAE